MTLHLYFARKFALTFAGLFAVFFVLMSLIDLVEQLRRNASAQTTFAQIIELTLLNAPGALYEVLPLVMILSTVALFLGLARSSELVVTRAAGRSSFRALLAPVSVGVIIGLLTLAIYNPIVATTSKRYHDLDQQYRKGNTAVFSVSSEGLWLRQADDGGQSVIRAGRATPDGTVLIDVTFLTYAPDGSGPAQRIQADRARLTPGAWELENAKIWPLAVDINAEVNARTLPALTLPSSLTQEYIRDTFGDPSAISVWDMPTFVAQLQEAGFSARRHLVWFHMELARPLFLVAMMLVGAAFTMRHVRFGKTGAAVLTAVLLGFGLHYVRNFAQILGENGQIPVLMAAWVPPVAALLLGLGILLHTEEG